MGECGESKIQEGWLKTNQNIVITWYGSEQTQFKKNAGHFYMMKIFFF